MELTALGQELERLAPWTEAWCVPRKWSPEHNGTLVSELSELDSFLKGTEEVLSDARCRTALAENKPVGRTHPKLGTVRNQVNVLCAQAVIDARTGELAAAFARLDQARSLAFLLNGGSDAGETVRRVADQIVLRAVGVIADDHANR